MFGIINDITKTVTGIAKDSVDLAGKVVKAPLDIAEDITSTLAGEDKEKKDENDGRIQRN